MKKYLAFYENEWPANIAELTAIENKPFVGYLKGEGVSYTVIPEPYFGPADNEIWYTSSDGNVVTPYKTDVFGANIIDNSYENGKGVIKFDNSVTSIGEVAFYSCKSLTSITIPESVTTVGGGMFCGCSKLESIVLPNKITSIPHHTESKAYYGFFGGCISLTSITIPNSVTSIGEDAFFNCRSLTSISFEGTIEEWNKVSKKSYWNDDVPATYVQCSDGQVAL